MSRVRTLKAWHEELNELYFGGKLKRIGMGLIRSNATDGYYEHYPGRNRKGYIRISAKLFDYEPDLIGTILHEMIHQYQHEVLKVPCDHDATFKSIARKLEKVHGVRTR